MKTLSCLALSGTMILALAAGATAQTVRKQPDDAFYGLATGRSAYVDRTSRGDAGATVMGLRVPHEPWTGYVPTAR